MIADACWACVCGLHYECYGPTAVEDSDAMQCCCWGKDADQDAKDFINGVGRPMLDPNEITDIKSTGRKRAAMLAPIFEGMECEWAGLKYAGGGVQPIVGCRGNLLSDKKKGEPDKELKQGDRHHGPDKNVLNNSVGVNLHRICVECHHRWHALNDPYYASERPPADEQYLPEDHACIAHDPNTKASEEDFEESDIWWSKRQEKRGVYPIALPDEVR